MKRNRSEPELEEYWSLSQEETDLIPSTRNRAAQLGFAVQLKILQIEGRFPVFRRDVPAVVIRRIAEQLGTQPEYFGNNELEGRPAQRDRKAIRKFVALASSMRRTRSTLSRGFATTSCHEVQISNVSRNSRQVG